MDFENIRKELIKQNMAILPTEELLFDFMVNFYHLLSIIVGNNGKTFTTNYCAFLAGVCVKDITLAMEEGGIPALQKMYDGYRSAVEKATEEDLKSMPYYFNGESDRNDDADVVMKLAAVILLVEKRLNITEQNILDTLKIENN